MASYITTENTTTICTYIMALVTCLYTHTQVTLGIT